MENLVIDSAFWAGRSVFLTGHTGFKGAWMCLVLKSLGARVSGFALAPESAHGIFRVAGVERHIQHQIGDVRDLPGLTGSLKQASPSIVIHMAAQSLVRRSYAEPVETYATNVMGTVHLLEAVRLTPGIDGVIIVTSDKCYWNPEANRRFRETDRLGGDDPYSSSKGCAELVSDSYRRSFFSGEGQPLIASARAGNVIGGGDWASGRLVPDAIRAFSARDPLRIRNPKAVRPWQHVLDPVMAYLMLAERLATRHVEFAGAWNFGPAAESEVPVERVADDLVELWGDGARWEYDHGDHPPEASHLALDCTKAKDILGWCPRLDLNESLRRTVDWYKAYRGGADMRAISLDHIESQLDARH